MKRALVFLFGSALSCALLAGCGGGGGGGNNGTPGTPTPGPVPTGVQAQSASFTLGVLKTGQVLSNGAAGPNAQIIQSIARRVGQGLAVSRPMAAGSRRTATNPSPPPLSPCTNKVQYATQSGSDANGPYKDIWLYTYYDGACQHTFSSTYYRERVINPTSQSETLDLIGNQSFWSNGSNPQVVTFSNSEIQIVVATGGPTLVPQSFMQTIETNPGQSQPPNSETGAACSYNGGIPNACGFANVNNVTSLNQDLGMTINLSSYSQGSTPDGGVTYNLNGDINGYTGALGALSFVIGTFPNWTMSGGSSTGSTTVTGSLDFDSAGVPDGGQISSTDSAHGVVVNVTIDATGNMSGIVKLTNGKPVASFNVDATGNGSLTLSDNTTKTIQSFGLI